MKKQISSANVFPVIIPIALDIIKRFYYYGSYIQIITNVMNKIYKISPIL